MLSVHYRIHPYLIYIVKQDIHIAGQTAGQIGLGGVIGLKIEICFQFFFPRATPGPSAIKNNEVLKLMFFF